MTQQWEFKDIGATTMGHQSLASHRGYPLDLISHLGRLGLKIVSCKKLQSEFLCFKDICFPSRN